MDLEGSGHFLIVCNIAAFVRRGWGNHKNPSPNGQNPLCYLNPLPPPSPPPSRGDFWSIGINNDHKTKMLPLPQYPRKIMELRLSLLSLAAVLIKMCFSLTPYETRRFFITRAVC
jgi:hypothetical protein